MMSQKAIKRLRETSEGQELITYLKESVRSLNIRMTEVPGETAEAIATEVVSRQMAIGLLTDIVLTLSGDPLTDFEAFMKDKMKDTGL